MEAEDIEPPLTAGERAELAWLRKENDFLRVQRDILMNVATGYAHDFEAVLRRDHH
ncbi:hypothetical protein SAMN04488074_102179 [Lentzea albidocapillata subsp. violacea]|uniref:Uncharacterized protein n=1 Tax=Lentzea albidocapillata subsp. violacea TaxID=128104 RepID=A0A1G8U621_9PSEU|nr:hypothetical protein [Lentzea albidocapillata]SDJ48490.1 hypothetical protein SAMN04488074_102179 [Lentzea albidocapillata subsp. violacea]